MSDRCLSGGCASHASPLIAPSESSSQGGGRPQSASNQASNPGAANFWTILKPTANVSDNVWSTPLTSVQMAGTGMTQHPAPGTRQALRH